MLDPVNIKYLAQIRQQEILDRVNGVHQPEPMFNLRATIARLWNGRHSPEPQPTEDWQPPRTIKHTP